LKNNFEEFKQDLPETMANRHDVG